MFLYTAHITPRLAYMAQWLGIYLLGKPLKIVTNKHDLEEAGWVLNYTNERIVNTNCFWIKPHPLLSEDCITQQQINVKTKDGLPYFFETDGDHHFDILAASFYLIQRYEEYLPNTKDMYGRYAHENSLAFKHSFLHLPLVDLWVNALRQILPTANCQLPTGGFIPTYDIDIACSYKGKGFLRNMAGVIRSFGQWNLLKERWNVLMGKQHDPFDVFGELDALHQQYKLKPLYFFLLAKQRLGYDKNLDPLKPEMQNLIQDITGKYTTGIHPSWQSGDNKNLLKTEIETLQSNGIQTATISRQHYIRMQLPETYQQLIAHGICSDHSMGYGSINGFRASTSVPYYWYNLKTEEVSSLKIFPFCYMDANSIFEQKNTPVQALQELKQYHDVVKKVGGTLITIFHNHLIGLDKTDREWMEIYKSFLEYQDKKK